MTKDSYSRYERAAGLVKTWVSQWGSSDHAVMADELVHVLRLCHEAVRDGTEKNLPIEIAYYLENVYILESPDFDEPDPATVPAEWGGTLETEIAPKGEVGDHAFGQLDPEDVPDVVQKTVADALDEFKLPIPEEDA